MGGSFLTVGAFKKPSDPIASITSFFTGNIDDLGLWDQALEQTEVSAIYNLAVNSALNYNLNQSQQMLNVFNGQTSSVTFGELTWIPKLDGSIPGAAGDVIALGNNQFLLNLGSGNGLISTQVPEPSSITLLSLLLLGFFQKRKNVRTVK